MKKKGFSFHDEIKNANIGIGDRSYPYPIITGSIYRYTKVITILDLYVFNKKSRFSSKPKFLLHNQHKQSNYILALKTARNLHL